MFGEGLLKKRQIKEVLALYSGRLMLIFINALALLIFCGLLLKAQPILQTISISDLLFSSSWHPMKNEFGLFVFIVSTLEVTMLAMIIAVPVCLLAAIYLSEYASRHFREFARFIIDILAGIPSVVYGLCGVLVIVPLVGTIGELAGVSTTGYSLLAGGLVLAVMVIPFIISITVEVLRMVPEPIRECALALGATKWETIKYVVLKKAKRGIMAAVVLGFARAFGETMAVLMVVGNVALLPSSVFDPAYPLPALIANNYGEVMSIPLYDAALMSAALILMLVVALFSLTAHYTLLRIGETIER
ncbi:MAG: phosphate ABC transporter permease subunit PstC [Deltaproteobacteria bacterium HGW-Deltaproteobacteria-2]|jgi:phosphate transport system permease protein|nr:MAG: phosphate ABC transporter permease subunit PstC [Deltaproteobacteria bacterium HGW-Deltaproteobacteria-2]